MEDAYAANGRLFVNPARYTFSYFAGGSAFQAAEMTCITPAFGHISANQKEQGCYKIAFTVTPRVEMKTYSTNGFIRTVTITKANVVLLAPSPGQKVGNDSPALPSIKTVE